MHAAILLANVQAYWDAREVGERLHRKLRDITAEIVDRAVHRSGPA